MKHQDKTEQSRFPMWRIIIISTIVWTLIITASLTWNITNEQKQTRELAIKEARANFDKDQAFRLWAAKHGGVYVPPNKRTPPNPYLSHIPDRDVVTTGGKHLTLMNPAYVIRQLMDEYTELYGIKGHITSLKVLNPDNAPDEWEINVLKSFENGEKEVFEFTNINSEPHVRLMRPMPTKEACLKCHSFQGYKVGDIRGGVGVSLPMKAYLSAEYNVIINMSATHFIIWLMGFGAICIMSRRSNERFKEREKSNAKLKMAKKEAEIANLAKSNFLTNMSHEIRTPMNGVIGMAELLQDTKLTDVQKEYLDMLKISSDNLMLIINDILDFSKIEAGKLDFERIDFNLSNTINDILKTLAVNANKKGVELACTISSETPKILLGDPGKLRQILINLVSNAIKFTHKGEVVINVDIDSRTEYEASMHFAVRDSGIGIPKDKREKIFEAFTQADNSVTRTFGGTGLGLPISSHLVENMNGKIWVESEENIGSTFHFTASFGIIPESFNKESQAEITAAEYNSASEMSSKDRSKINILLAEDNLINQKLALRILEKMGYTVEVANNGKEAIEGLKKQHFDIVLMDVQMPDMDGIEAAQAIRDSNDSSIDPSIPIIAVTAHAFEEDRKKFLEAGMNSCITKPYNSDDLYKEIEKFIVRKS